MATVTTRDKIWIVTLAYIAGNKSFRLRDLPIKDSERITAQRVWKVMEHMGILERHSDTRVWIRSFTAAVLLDYHVIGDVDWDDENDWIRLVEPDDDETP